MKVELLANMGAYLQLLTPGIPLLGQTMFNGIYKMDAYDFTCTGVFTTTTPTDAYRGAGPARGDLRHRADAWTSWPSSSASTRWSCGGGTGSSTRSSRTPPSPGVTYDSGNYEAATARAMELFDYDGLRAEQAAASGGRRSGPAGHRHLHLHRDVRPGAVPLAGRA